MSRQEMRGRGPAVGAGTFWIRRLEGRRWRLRRTRSMGAEYCFGGLVWRTERRGGSKAFGWTAGMDRFCLESLLQILFESAFEERSDTRTRGRAGGKSARRHGLRYYEESK